MKLSTMSDGTEIISEQYGLITVSDMKDEIECGRDCSGEKWYLAVVRKWSPDAKHMLDMYIEHAYDNMYDDWDVRVQKIITKSDVEKLQAALDGIFSRDNLTSCVHYGEKIEIDIMPKATGTAESA